VYPLLGDEKAQRVARHVPKARFRHCFFNLHRLLLVHGDSFLRQYVLARAKGKQSDLLQHVVGCGNNDRIHRAPVE
jgi:hypothetical protein